MEEEGTRAEATVPRNGDTVAKEPARDESLPRSGLLTRLQQLEHDLRHRVGIVAWNARHEEEAASKPTPRGTTRRCDETCFDFFYLIFLGPSKICQSYITGFVIKVRQSYLEVILFRD